MCTLNAPEGEACFDTKRVGRAHFPNGCSACCPNGTFNASVDVLTSHIGVELRVLPLLRFHKALCLLQFPFPVLLQTFLSKELSEIP